MAEPNRTIKDSKIIIPAIALCHIYSQYPLNKSIMPQRLPDSFRLKAAAGKNDGQAASAWAT